MLTADQVRESTFSTGFNGYKAGEVDVFLDSCADTIEELTNSNEELKKKMKILADKLVEYRQEESNIHSALMNAQRMGESVLREANQKASLILDDARAKAEKMVEKAEADIQSHKDELERVQNEVALFKNRLMALYKEHLVLIQQLPEPEEAEEPSVPVKEEETAVAETSAETSVAETAEEFDVTTETASAAETAPIAEEPSFFAPIATEETAKNTTEEKLAWNFPEEPQVEEDEPVSLADSLQLDEKPNDRFSNLQFGDEYPAAGNSRGFFKRRK